MTATTATRRRAGAGLRYGAATLLGVIYLVPIYWIVMTSFKSRLEAFRMPPDLFVLPNLQNYVTYLGQSEIVHLLLNSLAVTTASTAIAMVVGVLAAYALARMPTPGGRLLGFLFLSTRFVPPIATVVPLFLMLGAINLFDTQVGLIAVYTAMNVPYVVWMMRGFFQDLPIEIEEAAWIDGCTRLQALRKVVLPLSAGGLAATAVLTSMFAWNEFLYALLLTSSNAQTLPLSMTRFLGEQGTDWGGMAAAGTIIMVPALIFSALVQKQMSRGLTFGAVKG